MLHLYHCMRGGGGGGQRGRALTLRSVLPSNTVSSGSSKVAYTGLETAPPFLLESLFLNTADFFMLPPSGSLVCNKWISARKHGEETSIGREHKPDELVGRPRKRGSSARKGCGFRTEHLMVNRSMP